jgi:serine protease Do
MKATFIKNSAHLLAAFLLTAAVALTGAPAARSDNKEALASLEKSIVYIGTQWSGSIQVPPSADAAGRGYWTDKLKIMVTCTGWYASTSAQIVTAGHCVDPGQGRLALLDSYLQDQNATNLKDQAYANWRVEGDMGGSPPDRSVRAIQPNGVDGATITSPTTVEVVDFKATEAGDVALLHLPNMTKQTPGLVIAANSPQVGDPVTSIGFPGDLQDIADQSQIARASFKTGTISSNQVTPSGVVQIEVSTELAPGMSGGPTVNKDGQVVGVNSRGLTSQAGFNFITNTPDLKSFLMSHNVTLVKPPAPPRAGSGVQWYIIAAVAVVGAVVLGMLLFLVRRRRRTPQFAGVGGPPFPGYPMQGPPPSPAQGWMPGQASPPQPFPPRQTGGSGEPSQPGTTTGPTGASGVPPQPTPGGSSQWGGGDTLTTQSSKVGNFCGSCGAAHQPGARFCPQCGKSLS